MTDEIKAGRRHSESDIALGRKIKDALRSSVTDLESLGFVDPEQPSEWAAPDPAKAVIGWGAEVKALGGGKVGGYLVRFTDAASTDLTGDYFTGNTDFGEHETTPVLYHHGLDVTLKGRVLGKGTLRKDAVGIWVEAQLQLRDDYEKAVYEMAEAGKLGWSSGTAPHRVERKTVGGAHEITAWPLGLDASLTPTPAEPRNAAISLKAYIAELETAVQPAPDGAQAQAVEPETTPVIPVEIPTMTDEIKADNSEVLAKLEALTNQIAAMKAAPVEHVGGIAEMTEAGKAPAVIAPALKMADEQLYEMKRYLKREIGKDEWKAHNARIGQNAENEAHRKAYDAWIRSGSDYRAEMAMRDSAKATLVEGTASLGGNLVPQLYNNQIVGTLTEDSILRRAGANQFPVSGTNTLNVTTITRSASAALVAEGASVAGQEPTFGTVAFTAYAYKANYKASREVLADSRFDLTGVLNQNFTWQFVQSENNQFAIGTGASMPQGIAVAATTAVSAGSILSLLDTDDILDLFHSLPYMYRDNGVFFANDQVIKQIRKLRDASGGAASTGNYIWQPGLQAGQPDRLLGRPIYPLNTMASSGSSGNALVFADPRFFWIANFNLGGTEVQQMNELYAANWQIGWNAWRRFDSHLVVSEAAKGLLLI